MKKALLGSVLTAAFLIASASLASAKSKTWTGWISDSGCAAKGAAAEHKDCAMKCVREKGAKYVFVNSETKQVLAIHNQDAVKEENLGMEVKVTGDFMKDKSIHVEKINAAKN